MSTLVRSTKKKIGTWLSIALLLSLPLFDGANLIEAIAILLTIDFLFVWSIIPDEPKKRDIPTNCLNSKVVDDLISEIREEPLFELKKIAYDYAVYCYNQNGDDNIQEDYNRMLSSLVKLNKLMSKKGLYHEQTD